MNKKIIVTLVMNLGLMSGYGLTCDQLLPADVLSQLTTQSVVNENNWTYSFVQPGTSSGQAISVIGSIISYLAPDPTVTNATNNTTAATPTNATTVSSSTQQPVASTQVSAAGTAISGANASSGQQSSNSNDVNGAASANDTTSSATDTSNTDSTAVSSDASAPTNSAPTLTIPPQKSLQLQNVQMGEIKQLDGTVLAGILCTYQDPTTGIQITAFTPGYFFAIRDKKSKWGNVPSSNGLICAISDQPTQALDPEICGFNKIVNWP